MTLDLNTWLAYVAAILVFMATPGPSHLLMLATTVSDGFPRSLATAAGDLSANALQITVAGAGLFSILVAAGDLFFWVKWAGVAYLVWLGLRQFWRAGVQHSTASQSTSLSRLWFRGFATSAANPKAIVFFAALFPQFVDPMQAVWPQIVVLGATYLAVDGLFLTGYGLTASKLSRYFSVAGRKWLDRCGGLLMIATAALLGGRTTRV